MMTNDEKTIHLVSRIMEDATRCRNPECKEILRQHAFGLMYLAVELGICNMDDLNQLAKKYPKA